MRLVIHKCVTSIMCLVDLICSFVPFLFLFSSAGATEIVLELVRAREAAWRSWQLSLLQENWKSSTRAEDDKNGLVTVQKVRAWGRETGVRGRRG